MKCTPWLIVNNWFIQRKDLPFIGIINAILPYNINPLLNHFIIKRLVKGSWTFTTLAQVTGTQTNTKFTGLALMYPNLDINYSLTFTEWHNWYFIALNCKCFCLLLSTIFVHYLYNKLLNVWYLIHDQNPDKKFIF